MQGPALASSSPKNKRWKKQRARGQAPAPGARPAPHSVVLLQLRLLPHLLASPARRRCFLSPSSQSFVTVCTATMCLAFGALGTYTLPTPCCSVYPTTSQVRPQGSLCTVLGRARCLTLHVREWDLHLRRASTGAAVVRSSRRCSSSSDDEIICQSTDRAH